jgi:hypothetical protein
VAHGEAPEHRGKREFPKDKVTKAGWRNIGPGEKWVGGKLQSKNSNLKM